eukprot:m.196083 g.196083  ORF g.196083 m.196083 type:complete len:361 (+) comp39529_c0_seq26:682-1764(+)
MAEFYICLITKTHNNQYSVLQSILIPRCLAVVLLTAICVQNAILFSLLLIKFATQELYRFVEKMMSSEARGETIGFFHSVVLSYKYVAIFREKRDGSLCGMFLIDVKTDLERQGRRYNQIKMGVLLFRNEYRGGPLMYAIAMSLYLKCMITHPLTPMYIVFKTFSYKSYRIAAQTIDQTYPRFDKETPEWEKSLMDEFGYSLETEVDKYDPKFNVVQRTVTKLKTHATADNAGTGNNPHVKFFFQRNPGWKTGHCLIVVSRITWLGMLHIFAQPLKRIFRPKKLPTQQATSSDNGISAAAASHPSKKKLLRRMTTRAVLKDFYKIPPNVNLKSTNGAPLQLGLQEAGGTNYEDVDLPSPF